GPVRRLARTGRQPYYGRHHAVSGLPDLQRERARARHPGDRGRGSGRAPAGDSPHRVAARSAPNRAAARPSGRPLSFHALRDLGVAPQPLDLLLEIARLALPVERGAEVREGGAEVGLVPAARDPARELEEARSPQRLDQREPARLEVAE